MRWSNGEECLGACSRCCSLQKRPSPNNNGASASMQDAEQPDGPAKGAQRPQLAGLSPSSAAASSPEARREKRLRLEVQHADCNSQQPPASAAKRAERPPPQPPDPGLGGVSIQRCGQLRYHTTSASSDSRQHSSPPSLHQPAEAATRPEAVQGSRSAEQQQSQHTGEPSQDVPSASSRVGADRQRKLTLQWRVKMKECVDASPLILVQRHVVDGKVTTRYLLHVPDCHYLHMYRSSS